VRERGGEGKAKGGEREERGTQGEGREGRGEGRGVERRGEEGRVGAAIGWFLLKKSKFK